MPEAEALGWSAKMLAKWNVDQIDTSKSNITCYTQPPHNIGARQSAIFCLKIIHLNL